MERLPYPLELKYSGLLLKLGLVHEALYSFIVELI